MAVSAVFYQFSKRKNSTKTPTVPGTTYNVNLKSGTSLLSPTLILEISGRPDYNYFSFEGRYYFVTDIVSVRNNLWEISGSVDALGSWKSAIGATSANILYANGGRTDIVDNRIPVTSDVYIDSNTQGLSGDFTGFTDSTMGICLVSIIGIGSFGTYLLSSAADLTQLLKNIETFSQTFITSPETGFQQLINSGKAGDNLKSALFLPIILSSMGNFDSGTQLYLGNYPCTDANASPINGYRLNNPFLESSATVAIPWRFNDWRRNNPYTKVYLYVPLVGTMSIPSSEIVNEASITALYCINALSGDVAVEIKGATSGRALATASGNIAMSTPYGSASISGLKVASAIGVGVASVAAVALGAVTGGAATLAIGGGLASSAAGLLNALGGESAGGGGLGGSAVTGLDLGLSCFTVSHDLTQNQTTFSTIMGKPVMKVDNVGSYTGFVQTDGMHVIGNMTDSEHDIINAACDRGIYYE